MLSAFPFVSELLKGVVEEFHRRTGLPAETLASRAQLFVELLDDRGFDLGQLEPLHEQTEIPYDFLGRALVKQACYGIKQTFADAVTGHIALRFNDTPSLKALAY